MAHRLEQAARERNAEIDAPFKIRELVEPPRAKTKTKSSTATIQPGS